MQVQQIQGNHYRTNFTAINVSNRHFSGKQGQVSAMIIREFKKVIPDLQNNTLETHYKKNGYDFLIDTYPYYDLVSLSAYKDIQKMPIGLSLSQYKDIKRIKEIPIGIYSLDTLSFLKQNLREKLKI